MGTDGGQLASLEFVETQARVRAAVARLPARERRLLHLGSRDVTLAEIGAECGVCRERIRQVESAALAVVRRRWTERGECLPADRQRGRGLRPLDDGSGWTGPPRSCEITTFSVVPELQRPP